MSAGTLGEVAFWFVIMSLLFVSTWSLMNFLDQFTRSRRK